MAERPAFRFRLPWLLQAAPRPIVATPSPPRVTTTQNPAPTSLPTLETQTSIQPTTTAATTTTPAQRPLFRPARIAPPNTPPPQVQASPSTDSEQTTSNMPTSTTQTTIETQSSAQQNTSTNNPAQTIPAKTEPSGSPPAQASPILQALPSSSTGVGSQSIVSPQLALPSQADTQPQAIIQPDSPPRLSTQLQAASQPPSPSRLPPQARAAVQPLSLDGTIPQPQTPQHPQSPSHLASESSGETLSISSSAPATDVQPIEGMAVHSPSPLKRVQSTESSQPRLGSKESKTDMASGIIPNLPNQAPIEAGSQPTGAATQPSKRSGPQAAVVGADPKPLTKTDEDPEKTKGKMEMVEGTSAVAYEEQKRKTVAGQLTEVSGSIAQTREQPRVAFQAEEQQEKKEILTKEVQHTSILNGKHTKTMIDHPKDKNLVSESRQKPGKFSNREQVSLQKDIRDDIAKFTHNMATAYPKHQEKKPASVITLAGENRGAYMQLGSESAKREAAVHIHRGYKINPDESPEATTDGEERSKGRKPKDANTKGRTNSYINNNTQGINNSLVLESSITEMNPGVHLALTNNPTEAIKSNDRAESLEARKAEHTMTPSQKLTYEPTIQRRCLFMEPSDSDPYNPEKPHRHGCRYSCRDSNKDNEIDIL